jgi:hypothetical protein
MDRWGTVKVPHDLWYDLIMVKKVTVTKAAAEQFIRDVQETLAEANAMETSEYFMGGIEFAMERAKIPRIKARENKEFNAPGDDMVTFNKGPIVQIKDA